MSRDSHFLVGQMNGKAVVLFQIRYENTVWGDGIYLTGDSPALGCNDESHAVSLKCRDGCWFALVALDVNTPIVYRVCSFLNYNITSHSLSISSEIIMEYVGRLVVIQDRL